MTHILTCVWCMKLMWITLCFLLKAAWMSHKISLSWPMKANFQHPSPQQAPSTQLAPYPSVHRGEPSIIVKHSYMHTHTHTSCFHGRCLTSDQPPSVQPSSIIGLFLSNPDRCDGTKRSVWHLFYFHSWSHLHNIISSGIFLQRLQYSCQMYSKCRTFEPWQD